MSKQKTPPAYGGQAVVEGVMFGGRKNYVTAIRRNDGSIDFFKLPRVPNAKLSALKKIPFLRGIVAIIEASANGTKHLNFSSERYGPNPSYLPAPAWRHPEDQARIVRWKSLNALCRWRSPQ